MEKQKCEERQVCTATVRVSIPEHCPKNDPELLCSETEEGECDKECLAEMKKSYEKHPLLECCLFAPHDGLKHLNPRILLTLGGSHLEIPGWSDHYEEVDQHD